ncbi:ATP-binding protein [Phenylobacterium sp.]|uniref:ATP-binding protein n=1 Tax=Phenylobacterium sp. TaxID=1871053 RepID=UPI002735B05B|nr:ATP-binding protein [Phenylobacterium sp.]MDP3852264.1 ATP-binding protein [Phenylobacterium sp.]
MTDSPQQPFGADAKTQPRESPIARFVITLIVMASATTISLALLTDLQLSRVGAIMMAAVLVIAVVFGLTYGLLAGAGALVAFKLLMGGVLLPSGLLSEQGLLLLLFGSVVIFTGAYTDYSRRRGDAAQALLAAGQPLSAHASGPALGAFFHRAEREATRTSRQPIVEEIRRTAITFVVLGAGWAAVQVMGGAFGATAALLVLLGSVLVVASVLGARLGLAAGIQAILAALAFPVVEAAALRPDPIEIAFHLVAFAAFGWGVGRLADGLAHQRRSLETLVAASRDLTAGADESAIRRVLFDSLVKIADGGMVHLSDETRTVVLRTAGGPTPPSPNAPLPAQGSKWRARTLTADGRDVGYVQWAFPQGRGGARIGDDVAVSLIDLGASALVRARLNVEKSEMEFVARTEHLRTILLDAVSHHFRSPLAGILGSVTSVLNLPEQHDRGARREFLLIIKEQANRLNRYVENFLSVARLESGSIDVTLTDLSVEPLIYDVWETFGEAGGSRRFLHVKIDPAPVRADGALLAQVFGNVLENAIKFSAEGSLVDVRSRRAGHHMVFEVTDQGPGVPVSSQGRMFDRFFRSHAAKAPGLGLGLYITRSLVKMLGGSVEARNRDDGESGLVVSISLPLAGAGE